MLITWIIACCVLLFIVLVLVSPIVIRVEFSHQGTESQGLLRVRALYGIVRVKRALDKLNPKWTSEGPAIKAVHDKPMNQSSEETTLTASEVWKVASNFRQYANVFRSVWPPLRRVLKRLHMTEVNAEVCAGTGDAMSTGIVAGTLWTAVGLFAGELSRLTTLTTMPRLSVTPDFNRQCFEAEFHCIGSIKVGDAIIGAIRMLFAWLSIKKNLPNQTSQPRKEEKTWSTPSRG